MSDSYPGGQLQPPSSGDPDSRSAARSILPWVAGVAIVLVLAVVSGLMTAWLVANMNAAPGPVGGLGSPTPRPSAQASADPGASDGLPTAATDRASAPNPDAHRRW